MERDNQANQNRRMTKIMKSPARLILPFMVATVMAVTFPVTASANAPFDFSYRVTGATNLQPALIFNDGVDTYIEPGVGGDALRVVGAQSSRQGPYIVVFGLPDEFALVNSRNERATIRRQGTRQPEPASTPAPVAPAVPAASVGVEATHATDPTSVESRPEVGEVEQTPVSTQAAPQKTQAAVDQCNAQTLTDSTFVAVQFSGNSSRLGAESESRLSSASARSGLAAVRIRHMPSQNSRLDGQRSAYLEQIIRNAGVASDLISRSADGAISGMFEIEFVTSKMIPCVGNTPVVSASNGRVSVISLDADADAVLSKLAENLGLRYSTEGVFQPLPISVQFASSPTREALAAIGKELGGRATLILRDHELVLRYSNN